MIHLALEVASFLFLAFVGIVALIFVLSVLASIVGWMLGKFLKTRLGMRVFKWLILSGD